MVEKTSLQLFRYILFGIPSALCDIGVFMLCVFFFQTHYLVAQSFGFLAGIGSNYFLSTTLIFPHRQERVLEVLSFFITGIIGLLLSYALLWLFVDIWHITVFDTLLAKLLTNLLVLGWNFTSKKYLVFETPIDRSPS